MKVDFTEEIGIPEGIELSLADKNLKMNGKELRKKIPNKIEAKIEGNKLIVNAKKATKKEKKIFYTTIAHIKNILSGQKENYIYKLQICNVHFPITLKVEKNFLAINNFLGEKTPRFAKILPNVKVDIKGNKITVSSNDKEAAGQTAANIEKSTHVRNRDRRVFQDGIFLTERGIQK